MELYTMGFTQKSAEQFFSLIKRNNIELLIDVRLNNQSQLAGFTKGRDLKFFLEKICDCRYVHEDMFAPTKDILSDYKKKLISWAEYVIKFDVLLKRRPIEKLFLKHTEECSRVLLLCSEPTPEYCHRRLLAEYLAKNIPDITIKHI